MTTVSGGRYRVPAVEKALAILDLLATSDRALALSEVYGRLAMPKATAFMILTTLEEHQVVRKTNDGQYAVGVRLYELGNAFVSRLDIVNVARPHLQTLLHDTGLTSHLAVLDSDQVLFVDKLEPHSFVRFSTYAGLRMDIHICSLGKSLIAHLPQAEVERMLDARGMRAYTEHTITTREALWQALREVREKGYATEDEEGELNVRCLGAPVLDAEGNVAGAVSVTGLVSQLPPSADAEVGRLVVEAADRIAADLGTHPAREAMAGD